VKLPFYPSCEVKYGLQNRVSTGINQSYMIFGIKKMSYIFRKFLTIFC